MRDLKPVGEFADADLGHRFLATSEQCDPENGNMPRTLVKLRSPQWGEADGPRLEFGPHEIWAHTRAHDPACPKCAERNNQADALEHPVPCSPPYTDIHAANARISNLEFALRNRNARLEGSKRDWDAELERQVATLKAEHAALLLENTALRAAIVRAEGACQAAERRAEVAKSASYCGKCGVARSVSAEFDPGFQDAIQCPHCHEHDEDYCDYPRLLQRDGDTAGAACGYCEKDFRVTLCVSYAYKSAKLEGA